MAKKKAAKSKKVGPTHVNGSVVVSCEKNDSGTYNVQTENGKGWIWDQDSGGLSSK